MEEFKSNSYKAKELEQGEGRSEKKIQPVVTGSAKTKKKSEFRKILEAFLPEDPVEFRNDIIRDVILSYCKDAIYDIVRRFLYGKSGKSPRSGGSTISYQSYYQGDKKRPASSGSTHDYDIDSIIFENRADAEKVLDTMNDIIAEYQMVSVGDLYDLAGITITNYMANKYGWKDIRGCQAIRVRDGYILKLPKAIPLN